MITQIPGYGLFRICLAFTILCSVAMFSLNAPLKAKVAPQGVLSLQFSAYYGTTGTILDSWTPRQRELAMLGLGFDYLYMVSYSATIFLGLLLAGNRTSARLRLFTVVLAWLTWLAGLLDAVENYLHVRLLLRADIEGYAWPATLCATVKFLILAVAIGWLVLGQLLNGTSVKTK